MGKYINVPLKLINETNTSCSIILSYIHYRLNFSVSFIESNKKISENLSLSESNVARIIRKLKQEGYLSYYCTTHENVEIGFINNKKSQETIHNVYCRKLWLTKKGMSYYGKG